MILLPAGAMAENSLLDNEKVWTGDWDAMVQRKKIRVLVPYSKTFYFLDGATQRGISYEGMQAFEKWVNKKLGTGHLKVHVIMIPTARDELFTGLVAGKGDIALGNITIAPERLRVVDFSDPFATDIREIVVANRSSPPLGSINDLAGRKVFVRTSSSYYESLKRLNADFKKSRKKPIKIVAANEYFEDEDLLEMVNAGLIPFIVMNEHKAEAWAPIFENVKIYPNIALRTGGETGSAFRKKSPKLKKVINQFVDSHKQGTMLFNVVTKRYLKDTNWVKNAPFKTEFQKFKDTIKLFKIYADKYDFDWLMIASMAYQESGIDQSMRSPGCAVGVMQLLPSTAKDPNLWFRNVEIVAAREIGRETVQYVSNIYKYYTAYRLIMDQLELKKEKKKKGVTASK
jgi:membrane-bound lytic murein transglycosylase MltF